MKNRSKIFALVWAICLIFPAMLLLTACGGGNGGNGGESGGSPTPTSNVYDFNY